MQLHKTPYLTTAVAYYCSDKHIRLPQDFVPSNAYCNLHHYTLEGERFYRHYEHISVLDSQDRIDQLTNFLLLSALATGEY